MRPNVLALVVFALFLSARAAAQTTAGFKKDGTPYHETEKHKSPKKPDTPTASKEEKPAPKPFYESSSSEPSTSPPNRTSGTAIYTPPSAPSPAPSDTAVQARANYRRQWEEITRGLREQRATWNMLESQRSATKTEFDGLERQLGEWSERNAEVASLRQSVANFERNMYVPSWASTATIRESARVLRLLEEKTTAVYGRMRRLWSYRESSVKRYIRGLELLEGRIVDDPSGLGHRMLDELRPKPVFPEPRASEAIRPVAHSAHRGQAMIPFPTVDSMDWDGLQRMRAAAEENRRDIANLQSELSSLRQKRDEAAARLRAVDANVIQRALAELRPRREALDEMQTAMGGYESDARLLKEAADQTRHSISFRVNGKVSDLDALWASRRVPASAIDGAVMTWKEQAEAARQRQYFKLPDGKEVAKWVAEGVRDQWAEKIAARIGGPMPALWNGASTAKFLLNEVKDLTNDIDSVLTAAVRANEYGSTDEIHEIEQFATANLPLKVQVHLIDQQKGTALSWFYGPELKPGETK